MYESIALVTAFSPYIGYQRPSSVAKQASVAGGIVMDIIHAERLLPTETMDHIRKREHF